MHALYRGCLYLVDDTSMDCGLTDHAVLLGEKAASIASNKIA